MTKQFKHNNTHTITRYRSLGNNTKTTKNKQTNITHTNTSTHTQQKHQIQQRADTQTNTRSETYSHNTITQITNNHGTHTNKNKTIPFFPCP